jgi:hypothetical protein
MSHLSINEGNKQLRSTVFGEAYTRSTTGVLKFYINDSHPAADGTGGTLLDAGHGTSTFNFNTGMWAAASARASSNLAAIVGSNNGSADRTITGYGIFRADGTTLMFSGPLTAPILVPSGSPYNVPIGAITPTLGGAYTTVWGNEWLDHILRGGTLTLPTTDLEVDLVSTAPTADAAGTQVVYTGYSPLSLAMTAPVWTVTDNVARLTFGTTPSFAAVVATSTNPRGANVYDDVGGKRLFFVDWGGAVTLNVGNQLVFVADVDTQTLMITLD